MAKYARGEFKSQSASEGVGMLRRFLIPPRGGEICVDGRARGDVRRCSNHSFLNAAAAAGDCGCTVLAVLHGMRASHVGRKG
jgi:hypothetical protein